MPMQCEPGRYAVKVVDHALTEAKTGTLQMAFQVEVLGMVDPASPDELLTEHAGRMRTIFRPITDKTSKWFWEDLEALGFEGDDFVVLDRDQAAAAGKEHVSLAGKEVYARCTPNAYGDKESESWNFDMRGGGAASLKSADQSKVREAAARFGRKQVMQKSGAKPAPAAKVPAGADIPF